VTTEMQLRRNPIANRLIRAVLLNHSRAILGARRILLRERYLNEGLVSVVVPIYNVSPYLRLALDSIRIQRYVNLEVILVDDCSTDDSLAIAKDFADSDSRFVVIEKSQNGGLGAARNTGVSHATGEFITFVDSDDYLPVSAIYRHVASLTKTHSDFSIGSVEKFNESKRWTTQWMRELHKDRLEGTTLSETPLIVKDVFVWNKLFRTEFFKSTVGPFPEGILYEDQYPTALAFTSASKFDVLPHITYSWRIRSDSSSITQRRGTLPHLADRLSVMKQLCELYRNEAPENAYRIWLQKSLFDDFLPFLHAASELRDDTYWRNLRDGCLKVWFALSESDRTDPRADRQDLIQAVVQNDFDLFRELINRRKQ